MAEAAAYLKIFVAIFVLVNPLEGIPIFLGRSRGMDAATRAMVERTAAVAVTVILLVALFVGRGLLALLGISIGDFTAAGGLIILLIALKMVFGDTVGSAAPPAGQPPGGQPPADRSFALVPLAIPLLAGPGPISSVIVYASKGPTGQGARPVDDLILVGIILVVGLATWVSLRLADPLRRVLGDTGIDVATRVAGILVAAIAVGMMREGLLQMFPALAGG